MNKKISVIITVYNEAETIVALLQALESQTLVPDEVIITDAFSKDNTFEKISKFKLQTTLSIKVLRVKGNRSIGRNYAIEKARNDWIAITDAGCIPDKSWLIKLAECQEKTNTLVIAGNQMGLPKNSFQEAVVPYVLVMQEHINESDYLPATRSVLMHRSVWEDLHGFDSTLSLNEDFAFFNQVKQKGYAISFCRDAIIYWMPRRNLKEFFTMLFSFAKGDIQAHILRKKVKALFFRYFIFFVFFLIYLLTQNSRILVFIIIFAGLYLLLSITKNYRFSRSGWYWLPILQLTADAAVMGGSSIALLNVLSNRKGLKINN